jgi:hypothetical protein
MRTSGARTWTLTVIGVAAVVIIGAAVLLLTRSNGSKDAEPATYSSVGCDDDSSIPTGLPESDVRRTPFSADSPWNTAIAAQPTPAEIDEDATLALRAGTSGGETGADGSVHTWINAEQYSLPLFQADECDPVVTFEQDWESEDLSQHQIHIPADATPSPGTDANVLVVQPDGRTLLELFGAQQVADHLWKTNRIELVDLAGTGMGPDNGVRAFGGSAYGGLIRSWEIDAEHSDHGDGAIEHGLAIALPNSMLRFDGGEPGNDAEGYGTNLGYVAPATDQDFDSPWAYRGVIPMGSRVILPESVDIESLGLGPEARAIAVAMQEYGGYVVDRTGDGVVAFYAEPTAPTAWLDGARWRNETTEQLDALRANLVVISGR